MRKVIGPMRAGAQNPVGVPPRNLVRGNRHIAATVRKVGRGGGIALLSILFWYIFYQNLPGNMGLNALVGQAIDSSPNANTLDRIMKVCMIVMSVYVMATQWSLTRSLTKYINVGAAAVLALAGLSTYWSIAPDETLLRFISLASIALICFANSLAGWHRRRFQQLVIPPLMFILVASLALGVIYPDRVAELGDDISLRGSWHGITLTKNQFGMTASIACIICVNRWLAREGRTAWSILGAAIALICLVFSRSDTSLFAAMLGIFFMVLVMRIPIVKQQFTTPVVISIAATLILYELVIQNFVPGAHTLLGPVRALTGKDSTFSARTDIWNVVKDHIQWAPYLGTGYGAYWLPVVKSPSWIFVNLMYFYPTEAHNGYLDIVNDLGYVGLICLLAFLVLYVRQGLQLMRIDRNQAALYLALMFQMMALNMSESEWFARDSYFTILLLGMMCLSRALHDGRLQAQSAAPAQRSQLQGGRRLPRR